MPHAFGSCPSRRTDHMERTRSSTSTPSSTSSRSPLLLRLRATRRASAAYHHRQVEECQPTVSKMAVCDRADVGRHVACVLAQSRCGSKPLPSLVSIVAQLPLLAPPCAVAAPSRWHLTCPTGSVCSFASGAVRPCADGAPPLAHFVCSGLLCLGACVAFQWQVSSWAALASLHWMSHSWVRLLSRLVCALFQTRSP